MGEALRKPKPEDLDPNLDEKGNFIAEPRSSENSESTNPFTGTNFAEAIPQVSPEKQTSAVPYIELKRKIDALPSFERQALNDIIANYFSRFSTEERDGLISSDVAQIFINSSRPLSHWKISKFNTHDKAFEDFIDTKVRPAVEDMTENLKDKRGLN